MMVPLIQSLLEGDPIVRQQLGDPVRLFLGSAPQNTPLPYATWEVVNGSPTAMLSEPPPADGWRVRMTVWGEVLTQANGVAVAIRDVVERVGSIESYNPTPDSDGTDAIGISFDVRLLQLR
ncbi:tail completion protein gp17 [Stenotrophomonas geniculata]